MILDITCYQVYSGTIQDVNGLCSMDKPRGGRGHKAPYETTHLRVPIPIKKEIERLIDQYRIKALGGANLVSDHKLDKTAVIELAKKLIRAKTSKLDTISKLLTAIYGEDITISDLTE